MDYNSPKWNCNKVGLPLINDAIARRIADMVGTNARGTVIPGSMDQVHVNNVVMVHGYGDWRRGVVLKTGRANVTVGFTTQAALKDGLVAERGFKITVSSVPLSSVRVYIGDQP